MVRWVKTLLCAFGAIASACGATTGQTDSGSTLSSTGSSGPEVPATPEGCDGVCNSTEVCIVHGYMTCTPEGPMVLPDPHCEPVAPACEGRRGQSFEACLAAEYCLTGRDLELQPFDDRRIECADGWHDCECAFDSCDPDPPGESTSGTGGGDGDGSTGDGSTGDGSTGDGSTGSTSG